MLKEISKRKLYIVVFLTGAIVMILELIGSRILAPTLGTSTFVWASIIGVILGAMSLGYYYGGKVADRNPNWETFSSIIFYSGVFVFIIIIFKEHVLDLSAFFGVKLGSVFASTFLFAVPSFLLGMVSPYAVRLNMENVESSGETVGNLYAVSTFGSIVGTFAAGFLLIPAFGSINILYGLALFLFAISIFCYSKKRKNLGIFFFAVLLTASSVFAETMTRKDYLVNEDSAYSRIRVYDSNINGHPARIMSVEDFFDSARYLDSDDLVFEYTKYYALDEPFGEKINKAVMFGGAAYSVPRDFLKRNQEGTIDVVEIDPRTTEIARQYFGLKDDPRMNIFHEDARIFLNDAAKTQKGQYDTVYNDAFSSGCSMPFQLTTKEAVQETYDILDDDGVYIVNTISSLSGNKSTFLRAEYKTISEVFDGVYVFHTKPADYSAEDVQNIMIVATKKKKDVKEIIQKYQNAKVGTLLNNYYDGEVKTDDVATLTDDYSPVAYYAAAVCDTR